MPSEEKNKSEKNMWYNRFFSPKTTQNILEVLVKPLLPQPRRDLPDTALAVCCLSFPELSSQAQLCGSCPLSVGHIFGQVQVSASHSTCPVLKFNPHLL